MYLSFSQIKEITVGAERVCEESGAIRFYRFNKEEEDVYSADEDRRICVSATAGIRLEFETDAKSVNLGINVYENARMYFSLEVFSNNKRVGEVKNYPDDIPNGKYPVEKFPTGKFSGSFFLGEGKKHVRIIFPAVLSVELQYIELCGANYTTPIRYDKKMLIYGDSITQGFDALSPSRVYSARLCDYFGVEGINKAVAGAVYNPDLPAAGEYSNVDYVVGAYGINDWVLDVDRETFIDNCRHFWTEIYRKYPSAKKILITPIWIKIWEEKRPMGNASEIHKLITEAVSEFTDITIINGWELVPHDESLFGDEKTHPNNVGFDKYFENLISKIDLK